MTTKDKQREITEEELEGLQHEAFVLSQATGMLLKYGYKELATQLYNTARKIMDSQRREQPECQECFDEEGSHGCVRPSHPAFKQKREAHSGSK